MDSAADGGAPRERRTGHHWRVHRARVHERVLCSGKRDRDAVRECFGRLGPGASPVVVRANDRLGRMRASLDARIARATELAQIFPAARDLLIFYRELARLQKPIFEQLRDRTDLGVLVPHFPALLELVRRSGPEPLAEFGSKQLGSPEAQENLLRAGWERAVDSEAPRFYARVLLQPYAESLASRGVVDIHTAASVC